MGKDMMQRAVQRVRKELSMNKASKLYGILVTTLHDHVHAQSSLGCAERPTILTYNEEKDRVYACQVISKVSEISKYTVNVGANAQMHTSVQ